MKVNTYYIKKAVCVLILICSIPVLTIGQTNTTRNEYQKAFDEFNISIKQDFDSFKSTNDSIFYKFLEESWKTFEIFKDTRPALPKPIVQPVSDTATIRNIEIIPMKRRTILQDSGRQLILNGKPANFQTMAVVPIPDIPTTTINFYGLTIEIPDQPETEYTKASNKDIALYFKNASNNDYLSSAIYLLQEKAIDNQLNGWGYIQLLKAAALNLYDEINNQVLFTWFALLKSGFDAKVGYNDQTILLLVPFDVPIFFSPYFEWNNKKYYHVPFKRQTNKLGAISSYEGDYPGKLKILSLQFNRAPLFTTNPLSRKIQYQGNEIVLSYDGNLVDYYKTYPECYISVYFPPPLSKLAISSLDKFIEPRLKNKTDAEKVNFLLDFIQQAIDYETDEKQFGNENYLFAEETLCYPYADCEDRSVLLSQLVKEYVGLGTIAIIYPGHVSLGVNIKENVDGAYVEFNNRKYYTADPTYIGAKLGMIMPEFKDVEPEIIEF